MRSAKDSRLLAEQRRRKILDLIEQKGQITVRDLVEKFSISAVTARADLDALSSEGIGGSLAWRRGAASGSKSGVSVCV